MHLKKEISLFLRARVQVNRHIKRDLLISRGWSQGQRAYSKEIPLFPRARVMVNLHIKRRFSDIKELELGSTCI